MKTIRLYGDIARDFKPEWHLDVKTPAEALRAINANRPGFLAVADAGEYVVLMLDETDGGTARQVTIDNGLDLWGDEVMMVFPKIQGEFSAAIVGAISGSVIAASGTGSGIGAVVATVAAYASAYATITAVVLNVAISIAVSAIATLITGGNKGPGPQEQPENKPSYLFNGVVNTSRQGHRIPLLYGGPLLVGSMVLSSRVNTQDIEV